MSIREVRAKHPSGIYAGYFDNEASALAAVERLGYAVGCSHQPPETETGCISVSGAEI